MGFRIAYVKPDPTPKAKPKNVQFEDLEGLRFGIVTVTAYLGKQGIKSYWAYRCDCGEVGSTSSTNMKVKKSCGCLHRASLSARRTSHGESRPGQKTSEYHTWASMIRRCNDRQTRHYALYGGRGIKVRSRWMESVEHFISDMGRKPGPGYSLDRINNDGDYEPSNCRWATAKEQQTNRTRLHLLEWDGEIVTVQEACDRAGLKDVTVYARVRRGWTWEKAVTTPVGGGRALPVSIKDIGVVRREGQSNGI